MKTRLNFNCRPTIIGSVPYIDVGTACDKIMKYLKDIPAWPQLPLKSNLENMYIQYSEGFPGIAIEGQRITWHRDADFDDHLTNLYSDYTESKIDNYYISQDYASGLHAFIKNSHMSALAVKGQITGPISWGLCVTDETGRGILYDELLADALSKFLHLKAAWQERLLSKVARQTIIFIDEPYLASLGSAFVSISPEQATALLIEVLGGLTGIKGIHCCGSTDWSMLLKLPIDILNFDAYNYFESLSCYPQEISAFISRGGVIAWGIVPNDEAILKKETLVSLYDRFCEIVASFSRNGVSFREIISGSLITPTCGLATLSTEAAEEVFGLLSGLSNRIRLKYSS